VGSKPIEKRKYKRYIFAEYKKMIQDYYISAAQILMSVSLIPLLIYNVRHKICEVPFSTSIPTMFGLFVVTICFGSLNLLLSTIVGIFTTACWLTLIFQRYLFSKNMKEQKHEYSKY